MLVIKSTYLALRYHLRQKSSFLTKALSIQRNTTADYILDIAKLANEKFGKEIFYDESRNLELAEFGKDIVLEIIKKDLADVGIFIESWASEKALYDGLEPTINS